MNLTFNPASIEHPQEILIAPAKMSKKHNESKYFRETQNYIDDGKDYKAYIKRRISAYKDTITQRCRAHDDMSMSQALKTTLKMLDPQVTEATPPKLPLTIKKLTQLNVERRRQTEKADIKRQLDRIRNAQKSQMAKLNEPPMIGRRNTSSVLHSNYNTEGPSAPAVK